MFFFLLQKFVALGNSCDMVSMLCVEMHHIQLGIQSLLFWAEVHNFTQEATQAAR